MKNQNHGTGAASRAELTPGSSRAHPLGLKKHGYTKYGGNVQDTAPASFPSEAAEDALKDNAMARTLLRPAGTARNGVFHPNLGTAAWSRTCQVGTGYCSFFPLFGH